MFLQNWIHSNRLFQPYFPNFAYFFPRLELLAKIDTVGIPAEIKKVKKLVIGVQK
jgi:hypothetical protein